MARAYKNYWSLNTDEAIVTGILRDSCARGIEILMPLNAQMKDVDLVMLNTKNKKTLSIQVKGSRAFEPSISDINKYFAKYGDGSKGWIQLNKEALATSIADYHIFLVNVLEEFPQLGRRYIRPHTITVPTHLVKKLSVDYKKVSGSFYNYYFWIHPKTKMAFDRRNTEYQVSDFLDERGLARLNEDLK